MFDFFNKKKKTALGDAGKSDGNPEDLQLINEDLYKHNLEIASKNKTLSLLGHLYEVSIEPLEPEPMSEKMSKTICTELNLELVGLFTCNQKDASFLSLIFAYSERFAAASLKYNIDFEEADINVQGNTFLESLVSARTMQYAYGLELFWGKNFDSNVLKSINNEGHIRTVLAFPLVTKDKIIGMLVLGLGRVYDTLPSYDKETFDSVAKVVAIALDKAILYKEIRLANEKLQSLDKLKTEFLSLASHQLRSPLTAIKGYSSMILEGSYGPISNDAQKEAVSRVFQSSLNLAKVVDDLLNVSKIEQGGMQYEFSMVDVEKMAREITEEFTLAAANKKLTINFSMDGREPYLVKADLIKLRQVFLNFIDNSIKYTKEGYVHVRVEKDADNKHVIFSVSDSGMGMTPETKEKLFQKFSRGEGGKVNAGGSGLGLYLAKEIIEAHQGRVWVDSPGLGKGSTFYVEMKNL